MKLHDLRPHPGRQEMFLSTPADIAIYGGLAGCGKTGGLLLQPFIFLAHRVPASILLFRRTDQEIDIPGGLADAARRFYTGTGCRSRQSPRDHTWRVPQGTVRLMLHSLVKESQVDEYYGAELDAILFDELTHFTQRQFFELGTRRRSGEKPGGKRVKPFVRATCNPDRDHWLRAVVDWWIGPDGYAIEERVGVLRWFVVRPTEEDQYHMEWADSAAALTARFPKAKPMSFTYIQGRREDCPSTDWDEYDKSTANQPLHLQLRLGQGNWDAGVPDRARIWNMPAQCPFNDLDADFVQFVQSTRAVTLYGAWDFGRATHGLSWGLGALEPGPKPVLWIVAGKVWTGTSALEAARDRAALLESLDIPLDIGEIREVGDPSGWARGADDGWARILKRAGVPLVDLRCTATREQGKVYWNTHPGFVLTTDLVQSWLDSGRLRVRVHPSTAPILAALRQWRLSVPDGADPITVNRQDLPPDKGIHSHPGDMLRYLVAFVSAMVNAEAREAREARQETEAHPAAARVRHAMRRRGVGPGSPW
jgi:hypothetical protein